MIKPIQLNKYIFAEHLNIRIYLIDGASEAIYKDGDSNIFLSFSHPKSKKVKVRLRKSNVFLSIFTHQEMGCH